MTEATDLATCRETTRTGSHSFHAASRLPPVRVRDLALAVYAFCRPVDDAMDEGRGKARALLRLRDPLEAVSVGRPEGDVAADPAPARAGWGGGGS